MNHYEQYQLKRAYRLGYERQLVAARGAAEAKYLHTHEQHAQSGVWPTPYSAFETAAWPNTCDRWCLKRDTLINALGTLFPSQYKDGFLSYQLNDPTGHPFVDGYQGNKINQMVTPIFVYWRVLRSGLVYQQDMKDQARIDVRQLVKYVVSAVDTLVRWYSLVGLQSEAVVVRFRVTETTGKSAALPWQTYDNPKCESPEIMYEMERPRDEWSHENRRTMAGEALRDLIQQCGLTDPPDDRLSQIIDGDVEEIDRARPETSQA